MRENVDFSNSSVVDIILRYGLLWDGGLKRRVLEELSTTSMSDGASPYSPTAHKIFVALGTELIRGSRLTYSDIINLTGIPKSSAGRGRLYLERAGVITQSIDPNDGRRKFVELTDPYKKIVGSFVEDCAIEFDSIINLFDRHERDDAELKYRSLFDTAQVSIWNEDFSEIFKAFNQLRQDGVSDLRRYFGENKQWAWDMAKLVKVVNVNKAALKLFKAKSETELIDSIASIDQVFGPDTIKVFIEELCAIWENKEETFQAEANHKTLDGDIITLIISLPIPTTEAEFRSVSVSAIDITALKQAEEGFRNLIAAINAMTGYVTIFDADDKLVFCNEQYRAVNAAVPQTLVPGVTFEDQMEGLLAQGLVPEAQGREDEWLRERMDRHRRPRGSFEVSRQDGLWFLIHEQQLPDGGTITFGIDITERKQLEERLLRTQRAALGELTSREFEVFKLVASGHTNKAIAQQLDIKVRTIEAHRSQVMGKLGVKTLAEVVEVFRVAEKR